MQWSGEVPADSTGFMYLYLFYVMILLLFLIVYIYSWTSFLELGNFVDAAVAEERINLLKPQNVSTLMYPEFCARLFWHSFTCEAIHQEQQVHQRQ